MSVLQPGRLTRNVLALRYGSAAWTTRNWALAPKWLWRAADVANYSAQLCESLPMYDAKVAIARGKNTTIPDGPEPWKG